MNEQACRQLYASGKAHRPKLRQDVRIISLCLLLIACSLVDKHTETPTASGLISKQEAINTALKLAASPSPEVSGALVPPRNIKAEQLSLGEAQQRLNEQPTVGSGYSPEMPVWFVTMDGLWEPDGPLQNATNPPTQMPRHHYVVILDARTGLELEISIQP